MSLVLEGESVMSRRTGVLTALIPLFLLASSLALPAQTVASDGAGAQALTSRIASAPNPAHAFTDLNGSDRALVLDYLQVTRVEVSEIPNVPASGAIMPLVGGCWQVTWSVVGKDVFGFVVWQYNQEIYDWCGNGSTITTAGQVTRWASSLAPFWQYTPLGNRQNWGGVRYTYQRAWSEGQMALCIPPGGCEQYQYPWIDQTAYPNGTVGGSEGA
jgi:hypothetical protein